MSEDCENCDGISMELKGKWLSKTGLTCSLYQCLECKDIKVYIADESIEGESET